MNARTPLSRVVPRVPALSLPPARSTTPGRTVGIRAELRPSCTRVWTASCTRQGSSTCRLTPYPLSSQGRPTCYRRLRGVSTGAIILRASGARAAMQHSPEESGAPPHSCSGSPRSRCSEVSESAVRAHSRLCDASTPSNVASNGPPFQPYRRRAALWGHQGRPTAGSAFKG